LKLNTKTQEILFKRDTRNDVGQHIKTYLFLIKLWTTKTI